MACCSNPNIKSSALCDWCENCGYEYDYVNNTQTGNWWPDIPEDDGYEMWTQSMVEWYDDE